MPHHPHAQLRDARDRRPPSPGDRKADPPRARPPLGATQMRRRPLLQCSHPSQAPTASRSRLPGPGRVCSETRKASSRPPRVRTRRTATCSTKPRVCAGASRDRRDPVTPSVSHSPGSPRAHTTPKSSAHIPSPNSGGSPHSRRPRAVTSSLVSPLQPPAPALAARGGRRPQIPAVKMQRAKRVLQTMVPWCSAPSSGDDRALRARTLPFPPGGLRRAPGGAGGSARSAWAARAAAAAGGEAGRTRGGSVSCVCSRTRRVSAPSQPPSRGRLRSRACPR